jgi:hypothetical protein
MLEATFAMLSLRLGHFQNDGRVVVAALDYFRPDGSRLASAPPTFCSCFSVSLAAFVAARLCPLPPLVSCATLPPQDRRCSCGDGAASVGVGVMVCLALHRICRRWARGLSARVLALGLRLTLRLCCGGMACRASDSLQIRRAAPGWACSCGTMLQICCTRADSLVRVAKMRPDRIWRSWGF